jgi:hypothetical protein
MNNQTTEKANNAVAKPAPAQSAAPAADKPAATAKPTPAAEPKKAAVEKNPAPVAEKKAKPVKAKAPAANTRLSEMRHDPSAIRRVFETGEYPYAVKMRAAPYEERMMELQRELLKAQRWVEETGEKIVVLFEGRDAAGKGGTIKRYHGAYEPAHRARRGAAEADRARKDAMVFPALYRPIAGGGRNLPVRPLLVQSRRRRARHGLLLADRLSRIHAPMPGL